MATALPAHQNDSCGHPERGAAYSCRGRSDSHSVVRSDSAILIGEAAKAPFAFSGHRWPELGFFAKERKHFFHERVGCDGVLIP